MMPTCADGERRLSQYAHLAPADLGPPRTGERPCLFAICL